MWRFNNITVPQTMINNFINHRANVEGRQTNRAPKRILFYRDGISESHFPRVLDLELPLIRGLFGIFLTNKFLCSFGIHQMLVRRRESPPRSPSLSLESDTTFGSSRWRPTLQIEAEIARLELSWILTSFIQLSLISTCKATEAFLEHPARRITVCYTMRMDSRESRSCCTLFLC